MLLYEGTKEDIMNVQQLTARFQALNLNGSDLTIKVHGESVTILGRLVRPYSDYVDTCFDFYIEIDLTTESLGLCVGRYENNHMRKQTTASRGVQFYDSADCFRNAEAIANTLEALAA